MLIHNGKVIIFSRIKNLQQSGFSFYNFQLSKTKVWKKIKCSSQLVTASCSEFLIIYHYSAQLLYLISLQDQVCSFCNEPKVLTLKGGHVSCSLHLVRNELHITRFQNAHTKNEKLNTLNAATTANVQYIKILSNNFPRLSKIATVANVS